MGLFSIYTGFIYNDVFSKTLHLFHSGWTFPKQESGIVHAEPNGYVYPFGLDPGWHGADNALIFTNSYKMKMSIVLGVLHVSESCEGTRLNITRSRACPQMSFALCLQVPNHLRFNRFTDIYHGLLPQMLFLQSIFGYLVVCIIYKWLVDWSKSPTAPPSLLTMLIGMFLSPGTIEEPLYRGQGFVQTVLLLIAAVCVPWMLCVKPYLLWKETKRVRGEGYTVLGAAEDGYARHEDLEGEEEGHGGVIAADIEEEHVSLMALFSRI